MNNSGTLRKVVINGISFDVHADAKASFERPQYKIEAIPTTGDPIFKMTKRVQQMTGVDLACDPSAMESLKTIADGMSNTTLAVTFAGGDVYRTSGRVHFDKWESDTNKASVDLISGVSDGWVPFLKKN